MEIGDGTNEGKRPPRPKNSLEFCVYPFFGTIVASIEFRIKRRNWANNTRKKLILSIQNQQQCFRSSLAPTQVAIHWMIPCAWDHSCGIPRAGLNMFTNHINFGPSTPKNLNAHVPPTQIALHRMVPSVWGNICGISRAGSRKFENHSNFGPCIPKNLSHPCFPWFAETGGYS